MPEAPASFIAGASDFSPLVAQLLYNRGLLEPSQIGQFISGDERLSNDPFLLPGIHQAVSRVYRALLSGETIGIYGDFDVDGITAAAVLVQGLADVGGKAIPYIPHRINEGHGLRTEALEQLVAQGVSLVITVDCGTTDTSEIEHARSIGLDVIITDHHTTLEEVPPAIAVVNPKLPMTDYPFPELSGVGVAYKFLQALFQSLGRSEQTDGFLDLVAMGTIADMSLLVGENRYLVKKGLGVLNDAPRPGIREMLIRAGMNMGNISAENIAWTIAPRLNAAGRLEHALDGYRLLISDSLEETQQISLWLEQKNTERQEMTATLLEKAKEQIQVKGVSPLLFVSSAEFHIGVAGLVASRLKEEYYRPTIVVEEGEEVSHGSCRSIPEFNIILALKKLGALMTRFGGHSQAAGFTIPTRNLDELRNRLSELTAAELEGVDLRPHMDIDMEVSLPELAGGIYQRIQQLAPFGQGNPLPSFLSRSVEVIDCRTMGNGGQHLRLKLRQNGTAWDSVAFKLGDCINDVAPLMDMVYNLEIDRWGGQEKLRLNILDMEPS